MIAAGLKSQRELPPGSGLVTKTYSKRTSLIKATGYALDAVNQLSLDTLAQGPYASEILPGRHA